MINVKELRIGNYINDEQTTHIVVGVDNYHIKSYWLKDIEREELYETSINQIKPIQLTHEWLLKFGFEKIGNNYDLVSGNFPLWHNSLFNVLQYRHSEKATHVEYVHQLQNLYFSLSLQELKHNL